MHSHSFGVGQCILPTNSNTYSQKMYIVRTSIKMHDHGVKGEETYPATISF